MNGRIDTLIYCCWWVRSPVAAVRRWFVYLLPHVPAANDGARRTPSLMHGNVVVCLKVAELRVRVFLGKVRGGRCGTAVRIGLELCQRHVDLALRVAGAVVQVVGVSTI